MQRSVVTSVVGVWVRSFPLRLHFYRVLAAFNKTLSPIRSLLQLRQLGCFRFSRYLKPCILRKIKESFSVEFLGKQTIWEKKQKFSKLFKYPKFKNISYFGHFWGQVVIFGSVPDLISYYLGPNKKNWVQIKCILKTVNLNLKHPSHALWKAQICPRTWESQPNDTQKGHSFLYSLN